MIRSAVVAFAVALLAVQVSAQTIKQVEVINLPAVQDVNVVDAPLPTAPTRFQLVGFTSQTYTGAMGGHFGITTKCQLEFLDSRMCSLEEIQDTTAMPGGLSGSAWSYTRREDEPLAGDLTNCSAWRSAIANRYGRTVSHDGAYNNKASCSEFLPIACCAPLP